MNSTISCGEAKRKRVAEAQQICHGCGRIPDCQGCMEKFAYFDDIDVLMYVPAVERINRETENRDYLLAKFIHGVQQDVAKELAHFKKVGPKANIRDTVQLAHTLFETVASILQLQHPGVSAEDQAKLNALSLHGIDGMAMITGYCDTEDEGDEEEN